MQRIAVLGEGRGVEYDEVVSVPDVIEEAESIGGERCVARVAAEVHGYVSVGEFYGFGGAVHGVDECSPSAHGVERETASVAEHIQDVASFGVAFEKRAVFTLVNEEAGLLSANPVGVELESVFDSGEVGRAAYEVAVLRFDGRFEGHGALGFVVDVFHAFNFFDKYRGEGLADGVHTYGMGLHDGCAAVDVNHKAGKVVSFAVDEAIGIGLRVAREGDGAAQGVGGTDALLPESAVNGSVREREYAHHDAAYLVVSDGEECAVVTDYAHEVALLRTAAYGVYRPGEYPRVETQHVFFFFRVKSDCCHEDVMVFIVRESAAAIRDICAGTPMRRLRRRASVRG